MTSVNFVQNCIHIDVLCVGSHLGYTLAGIGCNLFIYQNKTLLLSKQIFLGERIHKISSKDNLILLKGGKKLALVSINITPGKENIKILSKIQCSDWIQDVILFEKNLAGLNTAHNSYELWDLCSRKRLKVSQCEENCILYSCKIIEDSDDNALIFSGTVFGDIVIWRPFSIGGDDDLVLHRLKGHNGAIFSIEVDLNKKILSTTSDDRSLRIWSIVTDKEINHWSLKNLKIQLIHTLYGHTARVWRSLIISNYYITIGEDSKLLVWTTEGKIVKSLSLHQESGIRCLSYSEGMIITGGEDGGINQIPWYFLTSETKPLESGKGINIGKNFSTRVCFVKNGFVYTTNEGCILVKGNTEEIIYKNNNFSSYCILEVNSTGDLIAMGSIKGYLSIVNPETKKVIAEGQYVDGRIYSIHWLGTEFITSGPDGKLNLWEILDVGLKLITNMILPQSRERWLTCGTRHDSNVIVGDRMGNLHVYKLNGGENPVKTFRKIHSYLGVTDILNDDNAIYTIGRDGSVKEFTKSITHSTTYKLPMEWPWKIIKNGDERYILGFSSVSFVVWSMRHKEITASHNCGGGHRSCDYKVVNNKLHFLYIKEKKVFSVDLVLDEINKIRNSFHGREINCLELIKTNPTIMVTGSEDTTLRISRIEKSEIEEILVLKTHISSVRAVRVYPITEVKVLVVSVGGAAQMIIWEFDLMTLKCQEMVNHHLRNKTRSWKCPTPETDPETRFMCVDIIKLDNYYFIATGCSDCQIRLFSYSDDFNSLCSIPYTNCVLNITIVKVDSTVVIASMGTDGRILFWNVTDPSNTSKMESFTLHQSGINSFEFKEIELGKYLLATGGDDNLISIALVCFCEREVKLNQLWKCSTTHSCQITGIKIIKDILITTSIDQRITIWKWCLKEETFEMKFLRQYMSAVPDIQGMDCGTYDGESILVCIHGKGIEILKVNISSKNLDDQGLISYQYNSCLINYLIILAPLKFSHSFI